MNASKNIAGKPTIKGKTATSDSLVLLYLAVLFLASTLRFTNVLDYTLAPRFMILTGGLLIITLLLLFRQRQLTFRPDLINSSLIAYFVITLLSVTWANNKGEALFEAGKVFLWVLSFFLATHFLKEAKEREIYFFRFISILISLFLISGFFQLVTLKNFELQNLYSITGLTGHKNLFSCFLFLGIPFLTIGLLKDLKAWKLFYAVLLLFSLALIVVLQTRAVWLGLMASSIVVLLFLLVKSRGLLTKVPTKIVLTSSVALVTVIIISIGIIVVKDNSSELLERANVFNYSKSETGQERIALWDKTLALSKDHIPLGVGAGNWQIEYARYSVLGIHSVVFNNHTFQRPHNDFLWVLSETGIPGILFYLLFFIAPVLLGLWQYVKKEFSAQSFLYLLLSSWIIGYLIIAFFDFPKERIELLILSSLLVAFLYRLLQDQKDVNLRKAIEIKAAVLMPLCLLFLGFNLYAGTSRIRGEYYMKKVYAAKSRQNWKAVLFNCKKASSALYTVDPTTIPIHWYTGLAYFAMQDYKKSFAEFEEAHKICPYNHHVLNNLASTYEILGNHDEAKKLYKESLRINPYFDDPKLNLAAIYYNEKNYQEALAWTLQADSTLERAKNYKQIIATQVKNQ